MNHYFATLFVEVTLSTNDVISLLYYQLEATKFWSSTCNQNKFLPTD